MSNFFCETESDKFIRENYFSDYSYKGIMVEVGGGLPDLYSTSKHWKLSGWRTIIFEPQPNFYELHLEAGNEVYNYAISSEDCSEIDFEVYAESSGMSYSAITNRYDLGTKVKDIRVKNIKLNTILSELGIDKVDILSIDTEGWELDVMYSFDASTYKYPVITLENFKHNEEYNLYMSSIGYILVNQNIHNYTYVNESKK